MSAGNSDQRITTMHENGWVFCVFFGPRTERGALVSSLAGSFHCFQPLVLSCLVCQTHWLTELNSLQIHNLLSPWQNKLWVFSNFAWKKDRNWVLSNQMEMLPHLNIFAETFLKDSNSIHLSAWFDFYLLSRLDLCIAIAQCRCFYLLKIQPFDFEAF